MRLRRLSLPPMRRSPISSRSSKPRRWCSSSTGGSSLQARSMHLGTSRFAIAWRDDSSALFIAWEPTWKSQQQWQLASELYERAIELDPLAETFYGRRMVCLHAQNRRAEAMELFRRCRQMLSVVLSIKPSAETEAIFARVSCDAGAQAQEGRRDASRSPDPEGTRHLSAWCRAVNFSVRPRWVWHFRSRRLRLWIPNTSLTGRAAWSWGSRLEVPPTSLPGK